MGKLLVILGNFILFAVLLVNRIVFQMSDIMNVILCVIAAIFMIVGILMKDLKIHR